MSMMQEMDFIRKWKIPKQKLARLVLHVMQCISCLCVCLFVCVFKTENGQIGCIISCLCVLWGSTQPSVESKTLATNTVV